MNTVPAPSDKGPRPFVDPETLAAERFGRTEGLMVVHSTKLELAEFYAKQHGLDTSNPDVMTTATLKAWTRFREFALVKQAEEAVYAHSIANGLTYDQALYQLTLQQAQKTVLLEITRLHGQARSLDRDLRLLKRDPQL